MSSSDEEIFDSSPVIKSINTSINSSSSTNKQTVNNLPCDFAIKDVSVKITQLEVAKLKENKKDAHADDTKTKKKKRVIRKWEKGIIVNKKDSRKRRERIALKLGENKAEEYVQDQLQIIEKKSTNLTPHQKFQAAQSYSESLEMSDKKKNTEVDQTYTSARILPYNFYQKHVSEDAERTSFNSSLFSSIEKNIEQALNSSKTIMSEENIALRRAQLQRLQKTHHEILELKLKKLSLKNLDKQIVTINDDDDDTSESDSSMELQPVLKKRRQRISSSENEKIIDNNNREKSFYERTEQTKSQPNIHTIREVRIMLTKLEDMINIDAIKQRQSREDALKQNEYKSSVIRQQSNTERAKKPSAETTSEKENSCITEVEDQETLERQNTETIWIRNDDAPSQTEDISKDSRLSIVSDTRLQKNCLKQSDNLRIRKLKKKYKLFRKPRVLLIKLETLQISKLKSGKYSASEVERLMKKYINFVMKFNCSFMSRMSYGFKQPQKESTDVNIVHTANASVSSRSAVNSSTEFAEKNPRKGVI